MTGRFGTPEISRSSWPKRKLPVVVAATVLGLFAVLTYGTLGFATEAVTQQIHQRAQAHAAVGVIYVENTLGAITDLARALSVDEGLLEAVGDGSIASIEAERVATIFGPMSRRTAGISAMAVITVDGNVAAVSPSSPTLLGVDFSHRDWFQGVRSTDDAYVSEAYVSAIADGPRVVGVAAPMRAADGTTIAYVLITYEVGAIEAFIDRFASRDISFTVTDQRGVVVGGIDAVPGELVSLRGDAGVEAALAGASFKADRVVSDQQVLTTYSPVPELGWTVRADVAASTAYSGVRTLRVTILSLAGVVVMGLCAALFALSRSDRRRRQAEDLSQEAACQIEAERNRLKTSLAETQDAEFRYRTVVDHLPNTAVMVWDADLRLETVAGPGVKTWRYAERNVEPGRLLEEIVDETELARLRPFYESGLRASGTMEYFSAPTGLFFRFDVTPMPNADGEPDRVLVMVRDITERRQLDQQLHFLANHDPLTGLLNRRGFEAELDRHIDNVACYGANGALVLLDLDHFKEINDTLGHSAGDEILIATADALRRRLRTSDSIARLGGDEFAVLLHRVDADNVGPVAQALVDAVRYEVAEVGLHNDHGPTVSVGVAVFDTPGTNAGQMIINADLAMYRAKAAGRDGFAIHSDRDVILLA